MADAQALSDKVVPVFNNKKATDEDRAAAVASVAAVVTNAAFHGALLDSVLGGLLDVQDFAKGEPVRVAAQAAAVTLVESAGQFAMAVSVQKLLKALQDGKWRAKVGALKLIVELADNHPHAFGRYLTEVITGILEYQFDTKKEVCDGAVAALAAITEVVKNPDVTKFVPILLKSMADVSLVPETVQTLASVTFIQVVDAATLAVIVPLLTKGLIVKTTSVRRQCCVIINNMAKLVEDPLDAAPFLPTLLPQLERASDEISDPEARAVACKALDFIRQIGGKADAALKKFPTFEKLTEMVTKLAAKSTLTAHVVALATNLCRSHVTDVEVWKTTLLPVLAGAPGVDGVALVDELLTEASGRAAAAALSSDDKEEGVDYLCDTKFTLAYGSKVLLHNTTLRLVRGRRYGLLGGNDSGKSSLLRAIADQRIEGFPTCRCVFVEADIQGEMSHLNPIEYILEDKAIQACNIKSGEIADILSSVDFTPRMLKNGVSTLSGGWRMKLALARAMLQRAEVMLFDEPTNHLDVLNVQWVKNYLNGLKTVTCVIVSHDSGLLNDCCSNILHIDSLKLHTHRGSLTSFVEAHPEAKSFFEFKTDKFKFKFPQPGFIPGIKSKGKALMRMTDVTFTYPGNEAPTIRDISIQVSLSSRVACVGVNGAGKSTMIKLLTGELEATIGTVWKHPSVRVAYVAQHAFHHIESHLTKTANEYIRWRYEYGEDKEGLSKVTLVMTPEEEAKLREPQIFAITQTDGSIKKEKRIINRLTGIRRPSRKEGFEYEVAFDRLPMDMNMFLSAKELEGYGYAKLLKVVDAKAEAREGMYQKPLTQEEVEKHLEDVGLEREFGTHNRIGALSGGQKVKVVLGACTWNCPHILILDEPTNYLDRDSLAALAGAITEFEGGVVMITHNNDFCKQLCPETWVLEGGLLNVKGDADWMLHAAQEKTTFTQIEEMVDATGNVVKLKPQEKAQLSRKELKERKKKRDARRARGEAVSDSEEEDS